MLLTRTNYGSVWKTFIGGVVVFFSISITINIIKTFHFKFRKQMKRPCVLLLPNSSSEFFLGRCGDLKFVGLYIETDPCVRDGTDGTYELR